MAAVKTKPKTSTKSKQLKAGKKKPLNKWLILGGVVTAALIGVAVVRFSSAATIAFYRNPRQISGGGIKKVGSIETRNNDGVMQTLFSSSEGNRVTKLCANYKSYIGTLPSGFQMDVWAIDAKGYYITGNANSISGSGGTVCAKVDSPASRSRVANGGVVKVMFQIKGRPTRSVGVSSIIGYR